MMAWWLEYWRGASEALAMRAAKQASKVTRLLTPASNDRGASWNRLKERSAR